MKTAMLVNRPLFLAGASAALALAAMSFAGSAHARDEVFWSVGVGSPGVSLNVGNAGPVYLQAAPVYVQPAPIYYEPQPVYLRSVPRYVQPLPVYYARPHGWNRRHHHGRYVQAPRPAYGASYYAGRYAAAAPVIYERDGWR